MARTKRSLRPKVPELWGMTRVGLELGVARTNVGTVAGLPEPAPKPNPDDYRGRLWYAAEIREFARERQAA